MSLMQVEVFPFREEDRDADSRMVEAVLSKPATMTYWDRAPRDTESLVFGDGCPPRRGLIWIQPFTSAPVAVVSDKDGRDGSIVFHPHQGNCVVLKATPGGGVGLKRASSTSWTYNGTPRSMSVLCHFVPGRIAELNGALLREGLPPFVMAWDFGTPYYVYNSPDVCVGSALRGCGLTQAYDTVLDRILMSRFGIASAEGLGGQHKITLEESVLGEWLDSVTAAVKDAIAHKDGISASTDKNERCTWLSYMFRKVPVVRWIAGTEGPSFIRMVLGKTNKSKRRVSLLECSATGILKPNVKPESRDLPCRTESCAGCGSNSNGIRQCPCGCGSYYCRSCECLIPCSACGGEFDSESITTCDLCGVQHCDECQCACLSCATCGSVMPRTNSVRCGCGAALCTVCYGGAIDLLTFGKYGNRSVGVLPSNWCQQCKPLCPVCLKPRASGHPAPCYTCATQRACGLMLHQCSCGRQFCPYCFVGHATHNRDGSHQVGVLTPV